jgi:hypothetical protein
MLTSFFFAWRMTLRGESLTRERWKDGASFLFDHFRLAGDERHRGVAVFADHGMCAAIRKVG